MTRRPHTWRAAPLLLLALPSCAVVANDRHDALTVAERHPVTIDQQTETLLVPVDAQAQGLPRAQLAAIDGFVSTYRTRGYGPITVTAPSGARDARAAGQTAADVRTALFASGVPYEEMRGATVRSGTADAVIVSFATYAASAPACGVYSGVLSARLGNRPHPNFGCASQANLAAMVADPRDLHQGSRATDDSDGVGVTAIHSSNATPPVIITYEAEGAQ